MTCGATPQHLITSIVALQAEKEHAYGVDWKRFGLVSSFFNVYRKLIRLRTVFERGWKPTADDTRLDTIIDLLNYLILSVLLHAELFPEAFRTVIGTEHAPEDFPTNRHGFARFATEVLLPSIAKVKPAEAIPDIIATGERAIEAWLVAIGQMSEELAGQKTVCAPGPALMDDADRLAAIHSMILLCVAAALAHVKTCPDEWERFVTRYGT
ncbi:hypothetical protein L0Y34_00925 [Candidatus Parcubacteria bacterium]|nr:hypothetical protein [Candidatus Parcubacteria bacterium]